jgi:hypothetical protein
MASTDIVSPTPLKGNSQQQPPIDIWSDSHLEDNIFNDLMENDNEIVSQVEENFERLRIGTTVIEISLKNLSPDTIYHIEEAVKHCKTPIEKHQILNGIIPNVIARIAKQVEPRILAKSTRELVLLRTVPNKIREHQVLLRTALNSIRELASNHWRLVN